MPFVFRIVLLASFALTVSPLARATDAPDPSVEMLVKQLADPDFKVRDAAAKALFERGEAARAVLRAAATSPDAEAAARAQGILAKVDDVAARKGLVLELRGETTVIDGQPVTLAPVLRNTGPLPVVLLRPIDGSDVGWRLVSYRWVVTHANGAAVRQKRFGRCGNVNPLQGADRVTLKPGETYAPVGAEGSFLRPLSAYYPLTPGTYRVSITYTVDATKGEPGLKLGNDPAGVLENVLPVEVASEPVTLTVLAAPAPPAEAPAAQ